MKKIWQRLKSDTPKFFQNIRALGLSITATGTALASINGIPPKLKGIGETAIWVGAVMAAISQLAVTDPSKLQQDNKGA